MSSQKKIPIKRNNMFYSDADFNFESDIGKEYIENDINQTIILYSVDRSKTLTDNLYGESQPDDISFLPPLELNCIYRLNKSSNDSYDKSRGLGRYVSMGNFSFSIYETTLIENETDIKYGDYIGVVVNPNKIEYFTVVNDGRVNYDNSHTMYGYKPFYRTIDCVYVDPNEFRGV